MGRYVELKKAGINYSGRCPFHNEKTPSFYVSPDRSTFKCFGCGEGGDVYTFLEKIEGLEFKEVLKKLSEETGIQLSKNTSTDRINSDTKKKIHAVLKSATIFWQKNLAKHPQAIEYLKNRNFTKQQLMDYQIGYAANNWDDVKKFLDGHNIPVLEQESAGLIKKGEKGKYYDRFRDRIIFPLRDTNGNVVAFSGRYIGVDDISAKYLNSPETAVFNKSKELYGLDMAKTAIRKNNFVVIVEGQVDLVMGQSVFMNTVATSGTALSKKHLEQIKRFCDRIVFAFDSDNAGIEAAHKASLIALGLDFQIKVAILPEGNDPADIISNDVEKYRGYIKEATSIFDFWIHHINNGSLSARDKNKKIEEKILPLLAHHTNPLEQDRHLKHCAFKLDIDEQALRNILTHQQKTNSAHSGDVSNSHVDTRLEKKGGVTSVELYRENLIHLTNLLLWQESLPDSDRWIDVMSYESTFDDDILEHMQKYRQRVKDENLDSVFFEIEKKYKTSIILENEIQELYINLRNRKSKLKQEQLLVKQKKLIQEGKEEEAKKVLQELSNLLNNAS